MTDAGGDEQSEKGREEIDDGIFGLYMVRRQRGGEGKDWCSGALCVLFIPPQPTT